MTDMNRRKAVQALGAAIAGPITTNYALAQKEKSEIVIGAAMPVTGIFSMAGAFLSAGMSDYIALRNSQGGILGHKIKYVWEDSNFKVEQGVNVFKKMMANEKLSFFYADNTGLCKAIAREALESGTVMTATASCAAVVADPVTMPHNFIAGPTYGSMHEILMEYIARSFRGSDKKPTVALVYTESEFGSDGIPASKARAQKLGIPIVAEIVTKVTGMDVSIEVAKLRRIKPDIVIFQGYIVAPIPEFVRQMRESGLNSQIMGTIWSSDQPLLDALSAMNETYMGVVPYRFAYDPDSTMMQTISKYVAVNRPQMKVISHFYVNSWLSAMIFCEVAHRCIKAGKKLTQQNMTAALRSINDFDTGGLTGLLADLSKHQISSGRLYRLDPNTKRMEPASGWIKV
jgi:branched-chain amino acid transport system substrate-binding protein